MVPEFPFPQKELWCGHRIFEGVALFRHLRLLFPGMHFDDDHPLTCSPSMAKYEKHKINQSKLVSLPLNILKLTKSCMAWQDTGRGIRHTILLHVLLPQDFVLFRFKREMHYGIRLAKSIVEDIALGFQENCIFNLSVRNRKHRFQDLHSWHICLVGHWNSVFLSFAEGCVLGVLYAHMYTYVCVYAMWEHVEAEKDIGIFLFLTSSCFEAESFTGPETHSFR